MDGWLRCCHAGRRHHRATKKDVWSLMLAGNDIRRTDELDKMSGTTRSVLLEVIEQQIFSIAETGINCQLSVHTPLLTTADPCESRWNRDKIIIQNHRAAAHPHLVSPHYPSDEAKEGETMDKGDQRNYIAYTKPNFQLVMTDLASQRHILGYAVMGRVGSGIGSDHDLPLLVGEPYSAGGDSCEGSVLGICGAPGSGWRRGDCTARPPGRRLPTRPLAVLSFSILTTGLLAAGRRRRREVAAAHRKMIQRARLDTDHGLHQALPRVSQVVSTL